MSLSTLVNKIPGVNDVPYLSDVVGLVFGNDVYNVLNAPQDLGHSLFAGGMLLGPFLYEHFTMQIVSEIFSNETPMLRSRWHNFVSQGNLGRGKWELNRIARGKWMFTQEIPKSSAKIIGRIAHVKLAWDVGTFAGCMLSCAKY